MDNSAKVEMLAGSLNNEDDYEFDYGRLNYEDTNKGGSHSILQDSLLGLEILTFLFSIII